jgi:hypothetical protein
MDAITVVVDLTKDMFQVALANRVRRISDHQRLTRRQFERFLDTIAVSTEVIMESCGTAHYWGRRCGTRFERLRAHQKFCRLSCRLKAEDLDGDQRRRPSLLHRDDRGRDE